MAGGERRKFPPLSRLTLPAFFVEDRHPAGAITPVPAAGPILAAAGVAALPSPPRKTRKTSHQEQIARQNERKRRAVQGQAHARRIVLCGVARVKDKMVPSGSKFWVSRTDRA